MENLDSFKSFLLKRNRALTLLIGNQKGGVGKTTNTYLIAYTLASIGINVLVADLDPQSNATKALTYTKSLNTDSIYTIGKTMMAGVQDHDLENLPINIMPNLDLLPSNTDFENFTRYLYRTTTSGYEEDHILEPLFEPLKKKYDLILLDTPPFSIEITKNASVFSDYVLISLQTQDDSLSGATEFIKNLIKIKQEYNLPIEVVGILPMLSDKRGSVDKIVLQKAREEFGKQNIFDVIVPLMARVKRFSLNGITNNDKYDRNVLNMYKSVTDELMRRILEFEG